MADMCISVQQEHRTLAKQFSKGEGASRAAAAEAVANSDTAEGAPAEDHRTGISRFMPTSRRIVQVGERFSGTRA